MLSPLLVAIRYGAFSFVLNLNISITFFKCWRYAKAVVLLNEWKRSACCAMHCEGFCNCQVLFQLFLHDS